MQLVLGNWANFQLHVSHATENQLHKTVAKWQFLVVLVCNFFHMSKSLPNGLAKFAIM
jgi:hypothetical protein